MKQVVVFVVVLVVMAILMAQAFPIPVKRVEHTLTPCEALIQSQATEKSPSTASIHIVGQIKLEIQFEKNGEVLVTVGESTQEVTIPIGSVQPFAVAALSIEGDIVKSSAIILQVGNCDNRFLYTITDVPQKEGG